MQASAGCGTGLFDETFGVALRSLLAPAFSAAELNALILALPSLQRQILEAKSSSERVITIFPHEYLKACGALASNKRAVFEKILQVLGGMRFLLDEGDGGSFKTVSIFSEERWLSEEQVGRAKGDVPASVRIDLTPSSLGTELLLGFSEPYHDLARLVGGAAQSERVLGDLPPLALPRSIWLDLQGVEQAIVVRLEMAMQWDFQILQLEGVFGQTLEKLFEGLVLESKGEESTFVRRLKALMRVGRKLCDHGIFHPVVSPQYLAFGNEAEREEPRAIWQVPRERVVPGDLHSYQKAVCRHFMHVHIDRDFEQIARVVLANAHGSGNMRQLNAIWQRIRSCNEDAQREPIWLKSNQPLLSAALFVEWTARQIPGHRFPLPEQLSSSEMAFKTRHGSESGIEDRFLAFDALLNDNPEYGKALRSIPLGTLTSAVSRALPRFMQDLSQGGALAQQGSPQNDVRVSDIERAKTGEQPTPLPQEKAVPISNLMIARMRRAAAEELKAMQDHDRVRYEELRTLYLQSLDEASRRLVLDVQRRMQPEMFTDHLHQRLIRFMVENPASWRSGDFKPRHMPFHLSQQK